MNKFTEEEKRQIYKFVDEAEKHFFKYISFCEKIEELLDEKNPDESCFIKDLLYQMGDGICVCYENPEYPAPLNIPLSDYLKGGRR